MKHRLVEKSFFIHAYIVGNVQTCILNTSIEKQNQFKKIWCGETGRKEYKTNHKLYNNIQNQEENLLRYTKTLVNIGIKMN